jgi:protein-tyrosine phosphatase
LSADVLSVAFVCTGNRFRSPLAAALLARVGGDAPVEVRSLGTLELGSVPVLPEAAVIASRLGLDLSGHRTSGIAPGSLADVDLVLGFERTHVAAAVIEGGAARERTFTLPELVELLDSGYEPHAGNAVERAREAISHADAVRRAGRPSSLPEVNDPLGRSRREQDEIGRAVETLTLALGRALFGART